MFRTTRRAAVAVAAFAALGLAGCSAPADSSENTDATESADATEGSGSESDWSTVTIEHALGTTTIEEQPERVAAIGWANHEVALALGIVPVGMPITAWGDDDGKTLYVTASTGLYRLRLNVAGAGPHWITPEPVSSTTAQLGH